MTKPEFARIEAREWYENGKYLGDAAPWRVVERAVIENEKTGDFYGEWQGTRHFDGAEIVSSHIAQCIEWHASPPWNSCIGEVTHFACRRSNWGEWRVVTSCAA